MYTAGFMQVTGIQVTREKFEVGLESSMVFITLFLILF